MYEILPYSRRQAKQLGVVIIPSQKKGKKITVIDPRDGVEIADIGYLGMLDYPTYLKIHGKAVADERRRLFRARTQNMPIWRFYKGKRRRSPAFLSREILW